MRILNTLAIIISLLIGSTYANEVNVYSARHYDSDIQLYQKFTAKTPTLITGVSDLVGNASTGAPKTSVGSQGDYLINTTHVSNKIYKSKTFSHQLYHILINLSSFFLRYFAFFLYTLRNK